MGDSRLATPANVLKWAVAPLSQTPDNNVTFNVLPEFDYRHALLRWQNGAMVCNAVETSTNAFCGNIGSSCFAMAIDLETSNGGEISGLNAEEQSDISLIARWNVSQATSMVMDVFTYIDSMIVLRENNVLELIQ